MSKARYIGNTLVVDKITFSKSGNVKVGNMWVWNTLKGDETEHINYKGMQFDCVGTCGKMCAECGCKYACYVNKSYKIYPSVKYSHAINTIALRKDVYRVYNDLRNQIIRAKKKPEFIRIHASGEFENINEICMFNMLAFEFPEITFYTYSKNFVLWDEFLEDNAMANNFILNVSIWHESGIDFFKKWSFKDNVKAFAYDDGFDYTSAGLTINTHCTAYDEHGKMNHAVTCDKCRKCMRTDGNCKVVACFDH